MQVKLFKRSRRASTKATEYRALTGLSVLGACLLLQACSSVQTEEASSAEMQQAPLTETVKADPATKAEAKALMASLAGAAEEQEVAPAPKAAEEVKPVVKQTAKVEEKVEPKAVVEKTVEKKAEPTVVSKKESAPAPTPSKVAQESKKVEQESAKVADTNNEPAEQPKVEVAKVEKPAPVVEKQVASGGQKLPYRRGLWTLRKGEALMDKSLVISTPTWEMGEDGFMSQIWMTVMDDKMLVYSSSDIDERQGQTGVRLDGGKLIPFSRIESSNVGVVEGDWIDALAKGNKLDIYMGFFPGSDPASDVYQSDVSLDQLGQVVSVYKKMRK